MSDDPKPEETPSAPPPQDAAPAPAPDAPASSPLPAEAKPAGTTASRPPIDYAMPAQKSFIPSPALIRNVGCLIKLIAGFTVLLCLGYFALVALNPKARQWALQGSKPGPGGAPATGKGPTPFKIVNQILAIPAQALGKTDDVVKANNARVGQLDGLVAEEEAKTKGGSTRTSRPVVDPFSTPTPAGGTSRPDKSTADTTEAGPQAVSAAAMLALAEKRAAATSSEPPAPSAPPQASRPTPQAPVPDGPDEMKLPGDIVIAQASPTGTPRASAAFFFWVVKLNVSGITQSKPARLLLNGRLTHEGDEVNRPLGIVFAQLDSANKLLIFKDATGATVTRSY